MNEQADIAILGAGLTGSCVALELARLGHSVVLIDRDPVPMNRASRRNEGKIHLGLIYAGDATRATAELQLRGALSFEPLLERWLGGAARSLSHSTPFIYLVARDSVLSVEALETHYREVEAFYRTRIASDPEANYLGARPETLARSLKRSELEARFTPDAIRAGFETAELAIDPDELAECVTAAVMASPLIEFRGSHFVREIGRGNGDLIVEGTHPGGRWRLAADQVVNATWENRMALDVGLGLERAGGWLHRLKYRVLARLPAELRGAPSVTMVLGRYGDVVVRPNGTAYLSWYPSGLRGWSDALSPPAEWDGPCRGEATDIGPEVVAGCLAGIDAWYPGIGCSDPYQIDAGTIVAYGQTDVDDPSSGLHDRTHVGVESVDGFHSVDPGKLTTAPLFAMEAAAKVAADARRPRPRSVR